MFLIKVMTRGFTCPMYVSTDFLNIHLPNMSYRILINSATTTFSDMVRPPRPSLKMAAVPYYLLVALFLSFVHYTLGGSATLVPMSKYQIDLDVSPDRRWIPLLEHFKSSAPLVVDYFQQFVRLYGFSRPILIFRDLY